MIPQLSLLMAQQIILLFTSQANDIRMVNGGTLTCSATCLESGTYMRNSSCSSPVEADCSGCSSTCYTYCASAFTDCAV